MVIVILYKLVLPPYHNLHESNLSSKDCRLAVNYYIYFYELKFKYILDLYYE